MRKHWIDNLRWTTVLLVLLYHVVYIFNNKGVFGGIGGFGGSQPQDALMYILYPWFMPLLFLLAGIGARYALDRRPAKEWFRSRTLKLLVPSTVGLLALHWIVGYFNTKGASLYGADPMAGVPAPAKYIVWAISGIGPLWFIQVLWLLSLVLLLLRRLDPGDKLWISCGKAFEGRWGLVWIMLLGILFWLGEKTLVMEPKSDSLEGLWNLYKPVFYLAPFLMGYYVFSHDGVQDMLRRWWIPLMGCAVASGAVLLLTTFGQDNTSPRYVGSPLNCLYGYLMCLAMCGWFASRFDRTGPFAAYMTRSSFGIYIVHYVVVASFAYMMRAHTQLPPWSMYAILTVAVFTLSPLLYEAIRRIPVLRWCVLGEKGPVKKTEKTQAL